jgi:DNA-binding Lrp family transcriptional regulator
VDATDREILALLQQEGRLTVTELADRVRLSISPCHRRLRALEASGTITGYRAQLDPKAVGLGFESLVFVTMRQSDSATLEQFEAGVAKVRNIVQAQRLFGDPDFLLRVVAKDLEDFQRLYDAELANLHGVQRLMSTLIMKTVVDTRPLPI